MSPQKLINAVQKIKHSKALNLKQPTKMKVLLLLVALAIICLSCTSAYSSSGDSFSIEAQSARIIDYEFGESQDRCTAIGVARLASDDMSTMTTHNNDCGECDFRITHVPARDWPKDSRRPVYDIRSYYPRYVSSDKQDIHGPDFHSSVTDYSIFNWTDSVPIGYIDQVAHTYAYTLGLYGIQNEKQVSIGESTCNAAFYNKPPTVGGKSLMHMETLTEIALERCATARCAVKLMGDLGVQYGFYGPESSGPAAVALSEAGEALTVSDPDETWMFHILSDDTGASAVWVAQRVPDEHITVVANCFVIGEINLDDSNNFLASPNIYTVAERNNLWSASSGKPFNFLQVYSMKGGLGGMGFACTRRVWRVFTLAAPSLNSIFSPYTDGYGSFGFGPNGDKPYPFSVKPDRLLSARDIMEMNRDQYEGTIFDVTKGPDAGPFGDPMRYPAQSILRDPVNGMTPEEKKNALQFQRAISIWRTSYATVTQSRKNLPNEIGAVTWISQYAPHFSVFVPVYANAAQIPSSLRTGSQYKLDKQSNWWAHCVTGNYISRWYSYAIKDVKALQLKQELDIKQKMNDIESKALAEYNRRNMLEGSSKKTPESEAIKLIQDFQEKTAVGIRDSWWDFFFEMAGKYRDMYMMVNPHAENFKQAVGYITYPRWWLEQVGFWGAPGQPPADQAEPMPVHVMNVPTLASKAEYDAKYKATGEDFNYKFPYEYAGLAANKEVVEVPASGSWWNTILCVSMGFIGGIAAMLIKDNMNRQHAYLPIN